MRAHTQKSRTEDGRRGPRLCRRTPGRDPLTSGHDLNVDGVREGSVPHGGEGQDLDGVGFRGHQVLNGGDDAVLDVVDLPLVHGPGGVHGVVHAVPFHLQ